MHSRFWYTLWLLVGLRGLAVAATPQWQWAAALSVRPDAIATDALGNSYVIGGFQGTVQLGSTQLVSHTLYPGDTDAFIAKFAPNGTLRWATYFGGAWASVRPRAIALDGAGNCYFTGTVRGTVGYGNGQTLAGVQQWPGLLVGRCSPNGQISWLRRDGSTDYASLGGSSIVADKQGNCYVVGAVTTPLAAGVPTSNPLRYQFFLASYSGQGGLRWANIGQSPTMFNGGQGITLDKQGYCYASGYYTGSLALAGSTLSGPGTMGFVGRFRQQDGGLQWLQDLGSSVGYLSTLTADDQGLLLAGSYQGHTSFRGKALGATGGQDAFLARFTPAGAVSWARSLPATPGDDSPTAVRCDAAGTSYVLLNNADANRGSGLAVVNNLTLATISAGGTPGWATTVAGNALVTGTGGTLDAQFRLYVTGAYDGSCQFGPHTLPAAAGSGFLACYFGGYPGDGRPASSAAIASAGIFPNPVVSGQCTVYYSEANSTQPVQLSLLDGLGRLVHQQTLTTPETRLSTQALPAGRYTLRLTGPHSSSYPLIVAP
ncbi:SBBP repeat-containing protein [Hymenobacter gummosus]|nr:SBBP repeat-containing protein [Hymenobacter gummosus]